MVDDEVAQNLKQTESLNLHQHTLWKTQLQECSMVVIRDSQHHNDHSVFPPINHENLQIPSHSIQYFNLPESPSSSSSSSSVYSSLPSDADADAWVPSSSPPPNSQLRKTGDFAEWMSIGLEILSSKAFAVVTSLRNSAANRGAIWSIGSAAAALVMSWWMCVQFWSWLRRRSRRHTHGGNHLTAIVKQKDEMIGEFRWKNERLSRDYDL
ncbi:uncharacterized protein G2W53_038380 [Senna tora]|uniref:Uncharacterized protein n=1 Tax=Senna tora TaxID=362788 RepID=A0A834SZB2_9FABA|nr:uncharacterized protein G2W53_038380 [Senna tora]